MFEYKVVPAPTRGQKARGVKGAEARFAYALEQVMNQLAVEGWEYVRAETLPSEERQGLTGTATHYRNLLVFRRAIAVAEPVETPPLLPMPEPAPADPPLTAKKVDDATSDEQDAAEHSTEPGGAAPDEGGEAPDENDAEDKPTDDAKDGDKKN